MTDRINERIEKHWEVIKAHADGKEIQRRYEKNNWVDEKGPCWFINHEYRVKPEKITKWVNIYSSGNFVPHNNKELAEKYHGTSRIACIPIEYYEGEGL